MVRARQYLDGCATIEQALAQLLELALELEELARAGYVLEGPVEADGLRMTAPRVIAEAERDLERLALSRTGSPAWPSSR